MSWLHRAVLIVALVLVAGCGADGTASDTGASAGDPGAPTDGNAGIDESAYLEEARNSASSVEPGEDGLDATLLAIGSDWCRSRGTVSPGEFFGEILIDETDGEGIARAADRHLCPD